MRSKGNPVIIKCSSKTRKEEHLTGARTLVRMTCKCGCLQKPMQLSLSLLSLRAGGGGAEKKKTQPVELSCRTEKNTTKTQIDGTSEQCTLFSRI